MRARAWINSKPIAAGAQPTVSHAGSSQAEPQASAVRRHARNIGLAAAAVVVCWTVTQSALPDAVANEAQLRALIERFGAWGPLAIIVLMMLAIVLSPIPSGPLAMVAGAAYGPVLGSCYIVLGATTGAALAFAIARRLGREAVQRHLTGRLSFLGRDRSQNALMAIVFVSRLVPFLSFDAISYAAGLTALAFGRFMLATFFGVIPVAVLFASAGTQLVALDAESAALLVTALAGVTLVPIVVGLAWKGMATLRAKPAACAREERCLGGPSSSL